MSPEIRMVMEFCLEQAEQVPVRKRILLYRGLAEFCGDKSLAAELRSMASALEAAEAQSREFAFRLSQDGK